MEGIHIVTHRLILRRFYPEDACQLLKILKFPQVACFMDERLDNLEDAKASVMQRSKEPEGTQLAVILKDTHEMIGYLFGMAEESDNFSAGWNFNPDFHGKGYAFEASQAYFTYLFHERGFRRIFAYVSPHNSSSRKLCERLGMRLEGEMKEHISFMKDAMGVEIYENTCIYAILKKEWKSTLQDFKKI